ncbi:leucine-rich repeat protein [Butyrivibrio sp. JL13D10]|uniref:leucine-rich repeat protein n=1 Tax=Butyrivibrio sp. JL13D10 TaxID=3236815 RepID=UPI0038B66633
MKKGKLKLSKTIMYMLAFFCASFFFGGLVVQATVGNVHAKQTADYLKSLDIILEDKTVKHASDYNEDYLAFIFGRTSCPRTNSMMAVLDNAEAKGISIKQIFLPVDEVRDRLGEFKSVHSQNTVLALGRSYSSWECQHYEQISSSTLPTIIILDKNRNVAWASVNVEYDRLYQFFGFVLPEKFEVTSSEDVIGMDHHVGDTWKFTPVITPVNASFKDVTWYVSDENVIKVDDNGNCKAVGTGHAFIIIKLSVTAQKCNPRTYTYYYNIYSKDTKIQPQQLRENDVTYAIKNGKAYIRSVSGSAQKNLVFDEYIIAGGKKFYITGIQQSAFSNTGIKSADFTKTRIDTIDKNAFSGCTKLKSIKLNAKYLKKVKSNAFYRTNKKLKIGLKGTKKQYKNAVKLCKNKGNSKAKFRRIK